LGSFGGANEVKADPPLEMNLQQKKNLQNLMPLEVLISKAETLHPGRLLEAELKCIDGRDIYEIETLDEAGKVWETYYDAQTGELINHEEEEDK
jgi:uncharacterized membrane protein YkoI